MADFTYLAAVAERLIEENGRSVTITKIGKTSADPVKPWRGTSSLEITITGVTTANDRYAAANGLDAFITGNIVLASGFINAGNNGLKHVTGSAATYVSVSENLVNETPPAGAKLTSVPPESVTGIAVFVGSADLGYTVLQEDAVRRGAEVALFAANNDGGLALEDFDQITDGSFVWNILRTEVLKPGSTRLLYLFEVKR